MRKILIITSNSERTATWKEREAYIRQFFDDIGGRLSDVRLLLTAYDDLTFSVIDGVCSIYDNRNRLDLADVDLVHFKNWFHDVEEAGLIARFLKFKGIKFFNSEADNGLMRSKINQMFILGQAGIPVPDTYYTKKPNLIRLFSDGDLPEGFKLPLIMKANFGSKGEDNYLIKDLDRAVRILKKEKNSDSEFVLQNYIENDGDYRFLFIGLDSEPLVIHRRSAAGSHLNNTSQGGQGSFIKPGSLPPKMLEYAREAARLLKREIGGTDVLTDKQSGKMYILEVNGTPALATGYGVEEKAAKFTEFLDKTFKQDQPADSSADTPIGS
jgi:glutathione synthase/RimK-type ligase-like ATP-grasp enzyme